MSWKRTLVAAVLSGTLLFAGAAPAYARKHKNCRQRVQHAERNFQQAIRRHGEGSPQAQQRREQLERVQSKCH